MIKFFFDIETLPCEEDKKEVLLPILRAKSKNGNGNGSYSDDELYRRTALDGTFGRICCIAYIKEGGVITKEVLSGDEKEILREFWQAASNVYLFVGHNIWDFDFPFIYKRSIILGVRPRIDISFARYKNQPIFDTMKVWEKWSNGTQKLDTLAKVLGFPTSKDEIDGSQVWDYYQAGKIEDICRYCMKDVELVRKIYKRMVFEEEPVEVTAANQSVNSQNQPIEIAQ